MLFVTEPCCAIFIDSFVHHRDETVFSLNAFVVMPDHFPVLMTLAQDKTFEKAVQYIKGGSAPRPTVDRGMHFPVWQRGFSDHRIRYERDFVSHDRNIVENPLRKNLIAEPKEFCGSSASDAHVLDEPSQGLKPEHQEGTALRHG